MPIHPKTSAFLSSYLRSKSFPSEDGVPDLDAAEIQLLYDVLNIRFDGTEGEWICFIGSSPGVSGFANTKLKALAFLLDRLEIAAEDLP